MKTQKIGKYEIDRLIGEGSFGKVYLANADGQQFALKSIPKKSRTNK
jgi:serine/threonine protein kinase